MTESEWNSCTKPLKMLDFLRGKVSERKLRLFALACCRRIEKYVTDPRSLAALEFAERYAERGFPGPKKWVPILEAALLARKERYGPIETTAHQQDNAASAAAHLMDCEPNSAASSVAKAAVAVTSLQGLGQLKGIVLGAKTSMQALFRAQKKLARAEETYQIRVLRDIFGNPFKPVTINRSWLTSTVVSLAQGIYDDRAFDRMPVLADALEESGCQSQEMLEHCRGGGEHVRGCWAVDLVLGKE